MTSKPTPRTTKIQRIARLRWIPIGKIQTPPHAQRELRPHFVDHLIANLDPEMIGIPVVSQHDDRYYILDGQHRLAALREWGLEPEQQIQCQVYEGLTEAEEANIFLDLNDNLTVDALSKFRVSVSGQREVEADIDRIVRLHGMTVSRDKVPGAIRAVGTLRKVYTRSGPATLARTLQIIGDAYGDPGLEAGVIDGLGLLCSRYNGEIDDARLTQRLADARGGVNALTGRAEQLRQATGQYRSSCVAAAAVELYNRGRTGAKLPNWWKANAS